MTSWMEKLGGAEAITRGILEEFSGFCAIPHPSWGEAALSEALYRRFSEAGLSPRTDAAHNLTVDLSATPGCEDAPLTMIQGHLDMVCAVAPGSGWDPKRDPVTPVVREGFLRSDGRSSLGADNNLGNAVVLWLLNRGVPHGPLRLLFTVAEEVGLEGARRVSPDWFTGAKYLLNTDGFHYGRVVVGSSGGRRETFTHHLDTRPARVGESFCLSITGGTGGHSGDDIHKGRCNVLQTLTRFLLELDVPYAIETLSGGQAHNVIPSEASAVLMFPGGMRTMVHNRLEALGRRLAEEYGTSDPGLRVELVKAPRPVEVWTPACAHEVLTLVSGLHHGVFDWHEDFPTVPAASANAARLWLEEGAIQVSAFLRCATREQEEALVRDHKALAATNGFEARGVGYPGWRADRDNPLAQLMAAAFREQTGEEPELTAVHVGLEPSILGTKSKELVMAMSGPDIQDAHSTDERARLDTLPRYAAFLAGTLEKLGQQG